MTILICMYCLLQMVIRRNFTVLFLMIALLLYVLTMAAVSVDFETNVEATVAPDIDIDDADFLPLRGDLDRFRESHSFPTLRLRQEEP